MRWKTFDIIENLVGRVLFTTFYGLMTFAWVTYLARFVAGYEMGSWEWQLLILTLFFGGALLTQVKKFSNPQLAKLIILLTAIGGSYLLAMLTGVSREIQTMQVLSPFWYVYLLFLAYFFLGFRYEKLVAGELHFMADFGLGTIWMILALVVREQLALPINFQHILLFFLSGAALGIYRRFTEIRGGSDKERHSWLVVTASATAFIGFFAILLTFGFTKQAGQIILAPIFWALRTARELLLLILWGIFKVFGPVINRFVAWLQGLIRNTEVEQQAQDAGYEGMNELLESLQQSTGQPFDYTILLRVAILIGVVIVLYIIFKKINFDREEKLAYVEERESVFDAADLADDFKGMINSVLKRFRRKPSNEFDRYAGEGSALRIRELYYRFLIHFYEKVPFQRYLTPQEYLERVRSSRVEQTGQVEQLTKMYELARYSTQVGDAELEQMEEAYQQVVGEAEIEEKNK